MINKGDAKILGLHICIKGTPIEKDFPDEIELTFNSNDGLRKRLSDGTIFWEPSNKMYVTFLTQEDTFSLNSGRNYWQLRLLKGKQVVSTTEGVIVIGKVISKKVLS